MAERRKFGRVEIDVAVKCKIIDPQKKTEITPEITARARNLSEGGALLEWPRSWPCDSCFNCLGWVYNFTCRLKEKGLFEEESNKDLIPDIHINVYLMPGSDLEPIRAVGRVSWVKAPEEQNVDRYQIGLSFIEGGKTESDFKKKITLIKKRFKAN